jgi:hypothetical protein
MHQGLAIKNTAVNSGPGVKMVDLFADCLPFL